MPDPEIDILINDERWHTLDFDIEDIAQGAMKATLAQAEWPSPLKAVDSVEISLLLANDNEIQAMNRDFRGQDKPTNVLSFAAIDDPDYHRMLGLTPSFHLGDLALALETLKREAAEQDKPLHSHFTHLIVHGTLHLLGYDHQETASAEAMETLEAVILNTLGIENPYNNPQFMPDW